MLSKLLLRIPIRDTCAHASKAWMRHREHSWLADSPTVLGGPAQDPLGCRQAASGIPAAAWQPAWRCQYWLWGAPYCALPRRTRSLSLPGCLLSASVGVALLQT